MLNVIGVCRYNFEVDLYCNNVLLVFFLNFKLIIYEVLVDLRLFEMM